MKIDGTHYRSIELCENGWSVRIFDQRQLPWSVVPVELTSLNQAVTIIKEMWTRGAPMIAMTGAYGLCLSLREDSSDENLEKSYQILLETRPTAVNLRWALDKMVAAIKPLEGEKRIETAYKLAASMCEEDVQINRAIGEHGLKIISDLSQKNPGRPVNILTHCNAGWLATVDYGTATSPIYMAHDQNIPVHVWVDETRPRNQGSFLTAFELDHHGVSHSVITDNAGGHLLQNGEIDLCIVGTDRVTANGDVCNKVGTYLKALAAKDNNVPFYVALPYPTIDYTLASGKDIQIEERSPQEVTHIQGQDDRGQTKTVRLTNSPAANPSFDITPADMVTGYITERGVFETIPSEYVPGTQPFAA